MEFDHARSHIVGEVFLQELHQVDAHLTVVESNHLVGGADAGLILYQVDHVLEGEEVVLDEVGLRDALA